MVSEINKVYNPQEVEDRLYRTWVEKGYFTPEIDENKEPFTIVIPPPNVTGQLHMGHALDETLQDILIRYKRMSGYAALWVPRHGPRRYRDTNQGRGNAPQRRGQKRRHDLGREEFTKRVWDWKQ